MNSQKTINLFSNIKWILLIVFLGIMTISKTTFAQKNTFGIETNLLGGKIFKHTKRFTGPIPSFSSGTEINFIWKLNGKKDWQIRRNYPTIGIGTTYIHYDSENYGYSIGIYPNIELPIYKNPHFDWYIKLGMALGYISKRQENYAPNFDTLNNAMGAHINNFSIFQTGIRRQINNHWHIHGGLAFTHMSSAKYRLPNLGINYIGAFIGARYLFNIEEKKIENTVVPNLKSRWLFQIRKGIGMHTGESIGSAATPVHFSSIYFSKRYWSKNKLFIGIDHSYHQSVYDFLRLQSIHLGTEKQHAWKAAIFTGHEFLYGRVGLHLQVGFYIKQAYLTSPFMYQKLGMNYYLIQHETGIIKELSISTLLKTHYATAETAELGIGLSF
jgi:hypothetical protein